MVDNPLAQDQQALQNFSPTREKVKFTLGKVLKWAAIGAVAGGIIAAGASLALTAGSGFIGVTALAGLATAALGAVTIGTGGVGLVAIGVLIAAGVAAAGALGLGVSTVASLVGGTFLAAALPGILIGAGIGAAVGVIRGMSGAQDAADDRRDELEMNVGRAMERAEMVSAVRLKHAQQLAELQNQMRGPGLSPQLGLPRGTGAEMGRA